MVYTPLKLAGERSPSCCKSGTPVHDVVVIGSGAGGGTVTKALADLGISVLLLEAGSRQEFRRRFAF